jgi:tetratricopeptide (TPR) repeat protein
MTLTATAISVLVFSWLALADLSQVQALIDAGHLKRARAIVAVAYDTNPNSPQTLYLLSQVREAFGDLESALKLADRALALDTSKAEYHYQVAVVCGELARKANVLRQLSLARRTQKEAQAAAALNPNHVDTRSLLVTFYMEAPGIAGGDKQKARDMAAELTRIDPVEGALAELEIAQDEHDSAGMNVAYQKLQSYPKSYEAEMALARHYASDQPQNVELAERYAKVALQIDSTRIDAYGALATLFAQKQRLSALDSLLSEAEKNVPDDLRAFYNAGNELFIKGTELPRAESYLRKYVNQEPEAGAPDSAAGYRLLNLIVAKLGRKP